MLNKIKQYILNELIDLWNNINIQFIITTLYCVMFILAPVFGNRIVSLFGQPILMSSISMPMTLGLIDILNQNYGLSQARLAVLTAAIIRVVIWAIIGLLMLLPTFSMTENFDKIIGDSFRFLLAGWGSTIVSQYFIDIPIFAYLKKTVKFGFGFRYNLSNIASGLILTVLFHVIAFWGTDKPIFKMIVITWIFQVVIVAGLMSPIWIGINKLIEKYRRV